MEVKCYRVFKPLQTNTLSVYLSASATLDFADITLYINQTGPPDLKQRQLTFVIFIVCKTSASFSAEPVSQRRVQTAVSNYGLCKVLTRPRQSVRIDLLTAASS